MLEKLAKWNPLKSVKEKSDRTRVRFKEPGQLQEALNHLFENVFNKRDADNEDVSWGPLIDISETANAFVISVELPGMERKEVDIQIQQKTLIIQGKKKREKKSTHEEFSIAERRFGRFYEAFALPSSIEEEKITALFERGVLTITLPKTPDAQPKRIPIEVA